MLSLEYKEMLKRNKKRGSYGDFLLSQCATNKFGYFSMQRVTSHRVSLSLIVYSSSSWKKNFFKCPFFFYPLKETKFRFAPFVPLSLPL